ncbi:MAG: ISAs1 family transposase [Chloroflexota bacterium]|nr:ISAs1 family transposase [Chloroflexota bacterium]
MSKKTLEIAKKTGNDVIVQVKNNQKTLFQDCQKVCETQKPNDFYVEPISKERNRIEQRKAEIYTSPVFTDKDWDVAKVVVKISRCIQEFNTKTKSWKKRDETSFYISTIDLSAHIFCKAIREHWLIENSNHYVRDVTMLEDKSRIRINAHIFAKLRSFALNILRKNNVQNISNELYKNSLKLEYVLNYDGIT